MTFDDPEMLAEFTASRIAEALAALSALSGRCVLALSGGSTPTRSYARLSALDVDWASVHVVQTDERVGAPASASSADTIERELVRPAGIQADHWHPMPRDERDPAVAARRYGALLQGLCRAGHPEIVVLGLGKDGHTASLFEPEPQAPGPVVVTGPYDGTMRLSLDAPTIIAADVRMMLATGAAKAEAVRTLVTASANDSAVPARIMLNAGELFLDSAAASGLDGPPDATAAPAG
jgi:6-phosphogluconolactonase